MLSAGPLPGLTQTAFRSEIYGALQAIRFGRRHGLKIRLWTDCLGVVKKLRNILRHKSIKPSSPHFDLWSEISEELEGLGHCNFVVTKVAAHQHIDEADGPLEQWAYLQNALVDRAARLANMCRDQHFWSVHASYAAEVESLKRITENVQKVILNIGRSAVERDAACQQHDGLLETVVEKADVKLPPVDPAYQLILPTTLPSSATKRFGFRQTSLLFSWLQHALSEAVETPPAWISFYQLYVDYQCATGDPGPVHKDGWVDPKVRPNVMLTIADFRKRCTWFTKLFKHVALLNGHPIHTATARPTSILLQLHAPVIWLSWSPGRIQRIEEWFGRHLHQAATRDGKVLRSLPLAMRDQRWPDFELQSKPLRF